MRLFVAQMCTYRQPPRQKRAKLTTNVHGLLMETSPSIHQLRMHHKIRLEAVSLDFSLAPKKKPTAKRVEGTDSKDLHKLAWTIAIPTECPQHI